MNRRTVLSALFLLTAVGLVLRLWQLGTPDLVGGDEGYYGTYARNILEGGFNQLLNLGREPLSAPDNKPFLFPLLLASSIRAAGLSEWALRAVPALAGLLTAWMVGGILKRRYGMLAAACGAVTTLLLPPLVYSSRVVMGEGVLAAFGIGGIWAAIVALEERRTAPALLAGALWGCGFLVKLWLVGLFIAPIGVALLLDQRRRREGGQWGRLFLAGIVFALVGFSHLILVAVFSPSTFQHWFQQYFIFSLLGRASGGEFASYWHAPWSYYLKVTMQTCFPVLPLALLALFGGERRSERDSGGLSQTVIWGTLLFELFLISFMAVKLRQYSFPLMPALSALAGIGASRLLEPGETNRVIAALFTGLLAVPVVFWHVTGAPLFPSPVFDGVVMAYLVGMGILLVLRERSSRLARGLILTGAALATLGGTALTVHRECLSHRTGYREAARILRPALAKIAPQNPSFLAPEVPSFQYYLFRTGKYWSSPYEPHKPSDLLAMVQNPAFRAFVTTSRDDLYGGKTPAEAVEWLAKNTREVTAEVQRAAGRPVPIRVFVKEGTP